MSKDQRTIGYLGKVTTQDLMKEKRKNKKKEKANKKYWQNDRQEGERSKVHKVGESSLIRYGTPRKVTEKKCKNIKPTE